jgi:uncharacterized protein
MRTPEWLTALTFSTAALIVTGCSLNHPNNMIRIVDVRQGTSYTCGVSCAQAILNYYGVYIREDLLSEELGTTEDAGTSPAQLVSGFEAQGLSAAIKENTTLDDLRENINKRIPTMVAIQAWLDEYPPQDWNNNWEDGHWVIAIGMDDKNIYFEDPSLLGSRGWMTQTDFLARWHDYTGDSPCCDPEDRKWVHLSISVQGKTGKGTSYDHID